jgi:hypothetical protein
MSKVLISATVAAALAAGTAVSGAQAQGLQRAVAQPGDAQLIKAQYGYRTSRGCYPGERLFDCRERLRWERRHNRRLVWRDGRYYSDDGSALAGAILGFALGAAVLGSQTDYSYYQRHRYDRRWRARCSDLPGFDWRTGTYIGRDGYRHYCVR